MIIFKLLHPRMTIDHLGYIPDFLTEDDPDSAARQIDKNYTHGGGWNPIEKFVFDPKTLEIKYPGDPRMKPLAAATLRYEKILFYDHAIVAIVQPDGSYEVARID